MFSECSVNIVSVRLLSDGHDVYSEQLTKHSLNIPGGTGTSGRRSVGYLQVPRQLKQKVANLVAFFGNYLLLNFSIEFTMVLVGTKFSTDTDLATAVLVIVGTWEPGTCSV
eukprot:SAG11_NODE_631_length_8061_cov_13.466843_2_plen_111_part_00